MGSQWWDGYVAAALVLSRSITEIIACDPGVAYRYAADPSNLPKWASGLAGGLQRDGADLLLDSPMGRVRVRFAAPNPYGILDHDVILPGGTVIENPFRIVPHLGGCEAVFIVRQLDLTEQQFDADCAAVARDLAALKRLLENDQPAAPAPG
ncbi:MAG: SRPBCC family protein [Antricoccus sp.]